MVKKYQNQHRKAIVESDDGLCSPLKHRTQAPDPLFTHQTKEISKPNRIQHQFLLAPSQVSMNR